MTAPTILAASSKPVVRIDSARVPPLVNWKELREYADLLRLFVWREIHLRYQNAVVGIGWAFIQPLLTMAVFVVIVPYLGSGRNLAAHSGGVPYALFTYCGLVPWTGFAHGLTRANGSLLDQAALLKNMYFPRILLPLAAVIAALAELGIGFVVLLLLMAAARMAPPPQMILLPLFLILLSATSLGLGLVLSILQARYRDILFLTQFVLQLGMLATPVWFPLEAIPRPIRTLVSLNPMALVVQGFRWTALGGPRPTLELLALSGGMGILIVTAGLWFFRRRQDTIADFV